MKNDREIEFMEILANINKELDDFNKSIQDLFGDNRLGIEVMSGGSSRISGIISSNYDIIRNIIATTKYEYLLNFDKGSNLELEEDFYNFCDGYITFEEFINKYPLKED